MDEELILEFPLFYSLEFECKFGRRKWSTRVTLKVNAIQWKMGVSEIN